MEIKKLELLVNKDTNEKIYPTVIKTNDDLILVDAGYPNMIDLIENEMEKENLNLKDLTEIWITHHDHDHVGSLASIKNKYPKVVVKSSLEEKEYIQKEKTSLRLEQAILQQSFLPEEEKAYGIEFQDYLRTIEPCKVDETLEDRDTLLDRQIIVVETSGHTKGHISFYIPKTKTLIAGDLLVLENDKLSVPFPKFAFNLEDTKISLEKISKLQIETIICYHGGVISDKSENMEKKILKVVDENKNLFKH